MARARRGFGLSSASWAVHMLLLSAAAVAVAQPARTQTAEAPQWLIVPGSERLEVQGTAQGLEILGRFGSFDAEIAFQPGAPELASVSVTIDTASWTSSLPAADDRVLGPDWLSVDLAPTARWVLSELTETGEAQYLAAGVLTIRDRSAPVPLSLTLKIDPQGMALDAAGTGLLDRRDFALGSISAPDEGTAGFAVAIRFEFSARRVEP
ncbi:MAG: YceI family protein [Pseudomonadota bacterium]